MSLFGNPDLENDSMPFRVEKYLKKKMRKVEFAHEDPNGDCEPPPDGEWIIIDSVQGISTPKIFREVDDIILSKSLTMHDYDLGMHLKLLKKIHPDISVKIIGVPMSGNEKKISEKVFFLISSAS